MLPDSMQVMVGLFEPVKKSLQIGNQGQVFYDRIEIKA